MSWASWLVAAVTVQYLLAAVAYWVDDKSAMALVFVCYAGANIGLIIAGES
jgi:hypothetical protein